MTREQYDAAQEIIDRSLGYEIALDKFGRPVAEERRSAQDDVIRAARELLGGVTTQQALFRTAEEQQARAERS